MATSLSPTQLSPRARLRALSFGVFFLTGAALGLNAGTAHADSNKPERWARGHILVKPKPGLPLPQFEKTLKRFLAKHSGKKLRGEHGAHVVNVPLGANEHTIADLLRRDVNVEYAELDRLLEPDAIVTNDPTKSWHLAKIGANDAWQYAKGAGVTIAILDTGVDGKHPDLAALMVPGWNFYDGNSNTADVYGHGTKVAGAAAASSNNGIGVAAVSWQSKIMPLRVSLPDGTAYLSTVASAITWAADNGARVANVSYQSAAGSASIQNAAQYMRSKGGMVVVSAGNTAKEQLFADSDALIAVSATTSADTRATFSSYGAYIDLAAPGASIYTTLRGGTYGGASGTSFSSPITAGVIALMMSRNPKLTPQQIEAILKSTALDLGTPGRDDYYGAGRINAAAAVQAAGGSAVPVGDTTAPTAVITWPSSGSSVSGIVTVNAHATDARGVAKVELFANGKLVGTDTATPYSFAWDSSDISGNASLVVKASDAAGNVGTSAALSVAVASPPSAADKQAPVSKVTSPLPNSLMPPTFMIVGTASDPSGVTRMSLSVDGVQVTEALNQTALQKWTTFTGGSGSKHTVTVRAWDRFGNVSTSSVSFSLR